MSIQLCQFGQTLSYDFDIFLPFLLIYWPLIFILQFAVHETVLSCLCPDEDWDTIPPFIQDLPANVLQVLLHYLYTGTLMEEQPEDTIRETLKVVESVTCLGPLVKMCKDYLEATAAINSKSWYINQWDILWADLSQGMTNSQIEPWDILWGWSKSGHD